MGSVAIPFCRTPALSGDGLWCTRPKSVPVLISVSPLIRRIELAKRHAADPWRGPRQQRT